MRPVEIFRDEGMSAFVRRDGRAAVTYLEAALGEQDFAALPSDEQEHIRDRLVLSYQLRGDHLGENSTYRALAESIPAEGYYRRRLQRKDFVGGLGNMITSEEYETAIPHLLQHLAMLKAHFSGAGEEGFHFIDEYLSDIAMNSLGYSPAERKQRADMIVKEYEKAAGLLEGTIQKIVPSLTAADLMQLGERLASMDRDPLLSALGKAIVKEKIDTFQELRKL